MFWVAYIVFSADSNFLLTKILPSESEKVLELANQLKKFALFQAESQTSFCNLTLILSSFPKIGHPWRATWWCSTLHWKYNIWLEVGRYLQHTAVNSKYFVAKDWR